MIEVLQSETTNVFYDVASRAFSGRVRFDYRRQGDTRVYSAYVVTHVQVRSDAHPAWVEESLLARAISTVAEGNSMIEHGCGSIFEQLREKEKARDQAANPVQLRTGLFARLRMPRKFRMEVSQPSLA